MESINLHELGKDIFAAFSELSGVQDIASHSVGKRLISEEQRFRLWAHSLGLHNHGHSSLDYRVRDAMAVKSRLADILTELKQQLENLVSVQSGDRQPLELTAAATAQTEDGASDHDSDARSVDTASSLSSDGTSFHEVDLRMDSIAEALDALYSLATKIKNPKNRPQRAVDELYKHVPLNVRKEVIQEREEASIAIICHVLRQEILRGLQDGQLCALDMDQHETLEQYASPSNWLVRRAGIANARRKQQFVYWKEHAERISQGVINSAPPPRPDKRKHNDGSAADDEQPFQKFNQGGHAPTQLQVGSHISRSLATSATRLDETYIKLDDLKSITSQQSRVSTVMNLRGESLQWPSPPVQTTSRGFFTCPYCKIICPRKYLTNQAWRVHLIHDLQPYHCTFERCQDANRIYGTRQEWLDHEGLHTMVWHCSIDDEEFETELAYTAHLHEKHPEQKAECLSPELVAAAVGPSTSPHRDCPFCPTAFSEVIALQKHITFHLERLALLTIPDLSENGMENSERTSDSHEGQRRGRAGSAKVDFTDEQQQLFAESFLSAPWQESGTKASMADIDQAVSRREEDVFLSKWLTESDSYRNERELLSPNEESAPLGEYLDPTSGMNTMPKPPHYSERVYQNALLAPTEEHFPYLPWRSKQENFNYRPQ